MTTEFWFAIAIVGSFILGSLTQSFFYNQQIKLANQANERRMRQETFNQMMNNYKEEDDE